MNVRRTLGLNESNDSSSEQSKDAGEEHDADLRRRIRPLDPAKRPSQEFIRRTRRLLQRVMRGRKRDEDES